MTIWTPAAFAIGLWWASTGVILLLNHLPARTFRVSMAAATVLLVSALWAVGHRHLGPYQAFTCGVMAWAWHEMSFFMGFVTGPRRAAGPQVAGWQRFWHASQTCLYHEAAIAITAATLWLISPPATHVALQTFLVLWIMRLSAKLNLFLGVRNLNEQLLPARLRYLGAYLRHRRMNWLLPFSVAGGLLAAAAFAIRGGTGNILVATLLALAVLEHVVMVVPIHLEALWGAFMRCPIAPARTHTQIATRHRTHAEPPGLGHRLANALPAQPDGR